MKQSPGLILLPNNILKSSDPFNNALHNIACLKEFRRYESHADSCGVPVAMIVPAFNVIPFVSSQDYFFDSME